MIEKIIVALIVLVAVGFAGRSLIRTLKGEKGCSCDGACKSCKDLCRNIKK